MIRIKQDILKPSKILLYMAGLILLALTACDSPTEKAQSHYQNGVQLFKEDNFVKAGLEFRNALQLDGNIADAWYHLALVEEKEGKFREYAGDLFKTIELDSQHVNAHIRIAKIMLFSGRMEEAVTKSDLVMRLAPEKADVWSLRAAVLFRQKKPEEAVKAAQKALDIEPAQVEATLVVAIQNIVKGNIDDALKVLQISLDVHENSVPLQMAKMQAMEKKGDKEGIEQVFRELINSNPDQVSYRNNLTRFYLQEGDTDKAEAEIRAIADENPDDPKAKLNIVRFIRSVAGNEVAKEELTKMIALEPKNYTLQFALSEIMLLERDLEEAKMILQSIIDSAGVEDAGLSGRNKMAELFLREGKREEANTLVEEVLVADNRNVPALMIRAAMRLDAGEVENSITDLRSALREQPDSSKATLLLARAHELNGAVELAEDRFDAAYKMANGSAGAGLQYAQFLTRRANYDRAAEILERSLRAAPKNTRLLTGLAQIKLMLKDWKGAEEIAETLRGLDKENVISDQILGRSFAGQQDFDKSMEAFEKAYESTPKGINSLVAIVRLQVSQGKTDEAKSFLSEIIEAAPDNYPARLLLGQLHALTGDDDSAVAEYKKVIAENPKSQSSHYILFTHYVGNKDFKEAQAVLDEALVAIPDNFSLQMSQAGLYELLERPKDAIEVYEKLLVKVPNSDVVINNLASLISTVYDDEENLRKAYTYAKKFRSSNVPHFKDTLGWIHYRLGEYELATPLFEDAVKKLPNFAILRYHLGMSYKAENNKNRAIEELSKAVDLSKTQPFPEAKDVEKVLEALKSS